MRRHGPQRHASGAPQFVAYEVALKAKQSIAEGTLAFTFAKPEGFQFTAGQHVRMTLLHPPETDRSGRSRFFSIASAPQEEDLVFAMRMRDTAFKRTLSRMPLGTTVRIEMMQHSMERAFVLHDDPTQPAVFLVGGIGIVPAFAIIKDAIARNLPHRLVLFYANRRPEDAPFLDELRHLAQRHPALTLIATMTHPEQSTDAWTGETGHITQAMLARYVADRTAPIYYIAGLTDMVNAMKTMLKDAGVPADNIRAEDFAGFSMRLMTRLPRPWRSLLMHMRRPQ